MEKLYYIGLLPPIGCITEWQVLVASSLIDQLLIDYDYSQQYHDMYVYMEVGLDAFFIRPFRLYPVAVLDLIGK